MDHVKNFYPDNYKMDLSETMKAALSKVPPAATGSGQSGGSGSGGHSMQSNAAEAAAAVAAAQQAATMQGMGYVTEKLYMLLQLYLQNKGWNPSVELLQCFSDLKDNAMLPSAAYLQVLANRLTLDAQGRLILRENGKIVLPFEHFANAVMLKHMSGPHGLHLSVDATVRAVVESYTIGRENFGMEKDFIIEVVHSCPSPACRYYKNHMGIGPLSFMDQTYPSVSPEFMQHLPPPPSLSAEVDLTKSHSSQKAAQLHMSKQQPSSVGIQSSNPIQHHQQQQQHLQQQHHHQQQHHQQPSHHQQQHHSQQQQHHQQQQHQQQQQQQQQITAAIIQQQNRAIAQQSLEKFGSLSPIEKQRVLQQLDKKHYEAQAAVAAAAAAVASSSTNNSSHSVQGLLQNSQNQSSNQHSSSSQSQLLPPPPQPPTPIQHHNHNHNHNHSQQSPSNHQGDNSKAEMMSRPNLETLESNKDLLALHNGAWANQDGRDGMVVGQDKIVRAFAELMRNMARMKTFIRPSMCKPYGKQSESLQKTLMDTIQLVQSLRNCLPAPHIPVSSWKSEDRHRKDPPEMTRVEN